MHTDSFLAFFGDHPCERLDDQGSVRTVVTVRPQNMPGNWPFREASFDVTITLNFGETLSYLWPWGDHQLFDKKATAEILEDQSIFALAIECMPDPPVYQPGV